MNLSAQFAPSNMTTTEVSDLFYPVIKNVRSLTMPGYSNEEYSYGACLRSKKFSNANFATNRAEIKTNSEAKQPVFPRSRQDHLNSCSFDKERSNRIINATYRKSYAYKIWNDGSRDCFPYTTPVKQTTMQLHEQTLQTNAFEAFSRTRNDDWQITSGKTKSQKDREEFLPLNNRISYHTSVYNSNNAARDCKEHYFIQSFPKQNYSQKMPSSKKSVSTSVIRAAQSAKATWTSSSKVLLAKANADLDRYLEQKQMLAFQESNSSHMKPATNLHVSLNRANPAQKLCHHRLGANVAVLENTCVNNTFNHVSCMKFQSYDSNVVNSNVPNIVQQRHRQCSTRAKMKNQRSINKISTSTVLKRYLAKKNGYQMLKSVPAFHKGVNQTGGDAFGEKDLECERKNETRPATVLTRINENDATTLAEGINNLNSEYFPIETLVKMAVKESSTDTNYQGLSTTTRIKDKVNEIDRAR